MKWNHLPVPGGIYAQHPQFLEDMRYIFAERAAYEEQKRREEERKSGRNKGASRTPGRRRR